MNLVSSQWRTWTEKLVIGAGIAAVDVWLNTAPTITGLAILVVLVREAIQAFQHQRSSKPPRRWMVDTVINWFSFLIGIVIGLQIPGLL